VQLGRYCLFGMVHLQSGPPESPPLQNLVASYGDIRALEVAPARGIWERLRGGGWRALPAAGRQLVLAGPTGNTRATQKGPPGGSPIAP